MTIANTLISEGRRTPTKASMTSAATNTYTLNLPYLPAGIYEVDVELQIPGFDVEDLYFDWYGQRTGPWDYSWLPGEDGRLLLPHLELRSADKRLGASRVLVPREEQLREKRFRALIGFQRTEAGPVTLELKLRSGDAEWLNVQVNRVHDLQASVNLATFKKPGEVLWLGQASLDSLKQRWPTAPWAKNFDRILDQLAGFTAPRTLAEITALTQPIKKVIRNTDYVVFPGHYLSMLTLRHKVRGLEIDLDQIKAWADGLTELAIWGKDEDPDSHDHNNDLAAAYDMIGLGLVVSCYGRELGEERYRKACEKIAYQTRELWKWIVSARSSWPGTSAQNHSYYGFLTLLIGAVTLLNASVETGVPEAEIETWLSAAVRRFESFVAELPSDGTYPEGVGYEPFGLTALLAGLSLLEQFTGEPWMPREWLTQHIQVSLDLLSPKVLPSLSVGDSEGQQTMWMPVLAWAISHDSGAELARKILRQFNAAGFDLYSDDWPIMQFFMAIWGSDQTDHPSRLGTEAMPPVLAALHRDSGHCITALTSDAKAYFLAGPPGGHRLARTEHHPYSFGHHQPDAGNVLLNVAGVWVLQDPGYVYRKASREHNVLTIDGEGQHNDGWVWTAEPPRGFNPPRVMFQDHGTFTDASLDLASYYPARLGLLSWVRRVIGVRGLGLIVLDDVLASHPVQPAIRWISSRPWSAGEWQGQPVDSIDIGDGQSVKMLSLEAPPRKANVNVVPPKPGSLSGLVYPSIELDTVQPTAHQRWATAFVLPGVGSIPTLKNGVIHWGEFQRNV